MRDTTLGGTAGVYSGPTLKDKFFAFLHRGPVKNAGVDGLEILINGAIYVGVAWLAWRWFRKGK